MRASWWLSLLVLLLSLSFLFNPSPSSAQVDRGGIIGLVTDPAGARVSGAQVTASNLATNQSIVVATDEKGSTPQISCASEHIPSPWKNLASRKPCNPVWRLE